MSEESLKNDINNIVKQHIPECSIEMLKREQNTASSMHIQLGVIIQDKSVTQDLVAALLAYNVEDVNRKVHISTYRKVDDLSVEIIVVEAEISYL